MLSGISHPFCDCLHIQFFYHSDNGTGQVGIACIIDGVCHKGLINLQSIDRKTHQVVEHLLPGHVRRGQLHCISLEHHGELSFTGNYRDAPICPVPGQHFPEPERYTFQPSHPRFSIIIRCIPTVFCRHILGDTVFDQRCQYRIVKKRVYLGIHLAGTLSKL